MFLNQFRLFKFALKSSRSNRPQYAKTIFRISFRARVITILHCSYFSRDHQFLFPTLQLITSNAVSVLSIERLSNNNHAIRYFNSHIFAAIWVLRYAFLNNTSLRINVLAYVLVYRLKISHSTNKHLFKSSFSFDWHFVLLHF